MAIKRTWDEELRTIERLKKGVATVGLWFFVVSMCAWALIGGLLW